MYRLLYLLLCVACWLTIRCSAAQKIIIDVDKGILNPECVNSSCQFLEYAVSLRVNNTIFLLQSDITVGTVVNFPYCRNVTITGGTGQHKRLLCNDNCTTSNTTGCGLLFHNCENVTLTNITIEHCAIVKNYSFPSNKSILLSSAVLIIEGKGNTEVQDIQLLNNNGSGMAIINTGGRVSINRSLFSNNKQQSKRTGGALFILHSFEHPSSGPPSYNPLNPGHYTIQDCIFTNNFIANKKRSLFYGGGLSIFMSWGAIGNSFSLQNNTIASNKASGGLGLFVACMNHCNNNTISVFNNTIKNNMNHNPQNWLGGGGGLTIGITTTDHHDKRNKSTPNGNNFTFSNCLIQDNSAPMGAGLSMFLGQYMESSNKVTFNNCHWDNNTGLISPAVDISPDVKYLMESNFLAEPKFIDCNFTNNTMYDVQMPMGNFSQYNTKSGVFLVTKMSVHFQGRTIFHNNSRSALYLLSASAHFTKGSQTLFTHNSGYNGGAINMQGFSILSYKSGTNFTFENNTALFLGGAIYVLDWDQKQSMSSKMCFLKYYSQSPSTRTMPTDVHFNFKGNNDSKLRSIYISSAYPCYQMCNYPYPRLEMKNLFSEHDNCLGNFHFEDNYKLYVATEPNKFQINNSTLNITPGEQFKIPIKALDDFNQSVEPSTIYKSSLLHNYSSEYKNDSVSIAKTYTYVEDGTITINGNPSVAKNLYHLLLTPLSPRGISVLVNFTLQQCPPGYVLSNNSTISCKCSAYLGSTFNYKGITSCNETINRALVTQGYWIGYDGPRNENNFYVTDCPEHYCNTTVADHTQSSYHIPINSSGNIIVCSQNRTGFLCGKCVNGTSVFFHSETDHCHEDKLCFLGPLFYILSELIPCVVLFVLVVVLEVNFTSGVAYSLVFFVQMLKTLHVYSSLIAPVVHTVYLLYGPLNLDFFIKTNFSFCLWSGAGTMDMLVMKYVTVLFAMGLVVCTVLMVNNCNCAKIRRRLCCSHSQPKQYSFVPGISAFLVICYSQCMKVAFQILDFGNPTGKGNKQLNYTVVFYDGTMQYFSGRHLFYAIPALIALVTIVIPPPLLLLSDPFLLWLEDILTQRNLLRGHHPWTSFRMRLKPVFDTFQGCFKDKFRFFAGLFFLYRIAIYLVYMFVPRGQFFYISEFILIFILVLQGSVQPFEKHRDNIVASLALGILLGINTINLASFIYFLTGDDQQTLQKIQAALYCTPLFFAALYIAWYVLRKLHKILLHKFRKRQSSLKEDDSLVQECNDVGLYDHERIVYHVRINT